MGLLLVKLAPSLRVDVVEDIGLLNTEAIKARKTGVLILGGGVPKHQVLNANLLRNGADFGVYMNTAQEFDGSDGGARPEEALSWGKLRLDSQFVKVYLEATLGLPLLLHSLLGHVPPRPRSVRFDKGLTALELEAERQKYLGND
ncbi:uncharacterized protein METZ01_LOCUS267028 [marine metagenome]|uniref:Deoxyhypusine synthase n=1 Tax=marine metagenome TaxID=408172 RepID=A0A382JNX8_9ZZZZ